MQELNIALIAGQIIMLLPIWEMDTKLQYLTIFVATVVIVFFSTPGTGGQTDKEKEPCGYHHHTAQNLIEQYQ